MNFCSLLPSSSFWSYLYFSDNDWNFYAGELEEHSNIENVGCCDFCNPSVTDSFLNSLVKIKATTQADFKGDWNALDYKPLAYQGSKMSKSRSSV